MWSEIKRYRWLAIVAAAAVVLPLTLPGDYAIYLAVVIGINTIVALGLNLLMGYAGQVSLGQAAFVGIGASPSRPASRRGWQ
jgi:branched-chain amino acid transport system permease protein